jgi:hypothetical protein
MINKGKILVRFVLVWLPINYRKPIEACQTNAKSKKKIGIIGRISTNGLNIE